MKLRGFIDYHRKDAPGTSRISRENQAPNPIAVGIHLMDDGTPNGTVIELSVNPKGWVELVQREYGGGMKGTKVLFSTRLGETTAAK